MMMCDVAVQLVIYVRSVFSDQVLGYSSSV